MSQITIDLSLTFTIPDTDVTINSLIHGLKQSTSQINGTAGEITAGGVDEDPPRKWQLGIILIRSSFMSLKS